jgi:hypothetical protein
MMASGTTVRTSTSPAARAAPLTGVAAGLAEVCPDIEVPPEQPIAAVTASAVTHSRAGVVRSRMSL